MTKTYLMIPPFICDGLRKFHLTILFSNMYRRSLALTANRFPTSLSFNASMWLSKLSCFYFYPLADIGLFHQHLAYLFHPQILELPNFVLLGGLPEDFLHQFSHSFAFFGRKGNPVWIKLDQHRLPGIQAGKLEAERL